MGVLPNRPQLPARPPFFQLLLPQREGNQHRLSSVHMCRGKCEKHPPPPTAAGEQRLQFRGCSSQVLLTGAAHRGTRLNIPLEQHHILGVLNYVSNELGDLGLKSVVLYFVKLQDPESLRLHGLRVS